ncbi:histone H1, gonadal-like [Frieseomelitta varia]|uniref:histone H1, gonadal-like n=1 Tax=Frieseomelitta varia TaxID=561572 RepID=UPI001CB6AE2B|nr:histone H1, gonadal-like [Frieseomelitta varia]
MTMKKKSPKIEAQVVEAIRRLQAVQGSTPQEISNYIAQEYNIPNSEIRPHVQLALKRGVTYGILQRMKGGCYSYNPDYEQRPEGHAARSTVVEIPCPQADRFRKRALKKRRERRKRAKAARERRAREKREKSRRRARARRARRRSRRSRGRGRQRRRRRRRSRSTRSRQRRGRRREQLPGEIDALGMTTNVTDLAKQQPIPTKSCSSSHLSNDHSTISASSVEKQD